MNINDLEQQSDDYNEMFVITDDLGNITQYIYANDQTLSGYLTNLGINQNQLSTITESNNISVDEVQTNNPFIDAGLVIVIIALFSIFGAIAVNPLIRSLRGRN